MRAKFDGWCRECRHSYSAGSEIEKGPRGWAHASCVGGSRRPAPVTTAPVAAISSFFNGASGAVSEGMFCLAFCYHLAVVQIVKALPVRRFDAATKSWWVGGASYAALVTALETVEPRAAAELREDERFESARKLAAQLQEQLAESRAADADITVPAPEGLSYRPFQLAGIRYALSRRATLIGDEMGLGKTIQAIGVVNASPEIKRVLIACPASLRLNWARELRTWLTRDLSVGVAEGDSLPATDVIVINYDILARHADTLRQVEWDLVVLDECHRLKNPKAQRTQAVYGTRGKPGEDGVPGLSFKKLIALTGTPIPNRPNELWTLVQAMDPQGLGRSWKQFHVRYCDAQQNRYGWDTKGASNLDELQDRMRQAFMVRRLKSQVWTEMPKKMRQILVLPRNGAGKIVAAEQAETVALRERLAQLHADLEAAIEAGAEHAYEEIAEQLSAFGGVAFEAMARARLATALAKVDYVAEHVRDLCEGNDQKVVVFAWHREVADRLMAALAEFNPVKLVGGMSSAESDGAVHSFQTDPSVRVFIGNIQAAGVGHTLTASNHVIFAELSMVPGDMTQAEDRCHRLGQESDRVVVQHLVLEGSLDEHLVHMLLQKQEVADAALDDDTTDARREREQSLVATLLGLGEYAAKQADARKRIEAARKATAERREREEKENPLTASQIDAIHLGLRMLAGMCDGAHSKDGAGFNKLDTSFGHQLAAQLALTPAQARAAQRMIQRYQRQLPVEVVRDAGVEPMDEKAERKAAKPRKSRKVTVKSEPVAVELTAEERAANYSDWLAEVSAALFAACGVTLAQAIRRLELPANTLKAAGALKAGEAVEPAVYAAQLQAQL